MVWMTVVSWYGAGLLGLLEYVDRVMLPTAQAAYDKHDVGSWFRFGKTAVGLLLLVMVIAVIDRSLRQARPALPAAEAGARPRAVGLAFPTPATLTVGGLVLVVAGLAVTGLLLALQTPIDAAVRGPLVCMLSAAIGSSITTVMGYLKHACDQKDFDLAFAPWYVCRPMTGAMLGLIFYFILRGGFIALATNASTQFDDFALAGMGGLVGLFSKNALDKLREVFDVIFKVEKATDPTQRVSKVVSSKTE